MTETTETAATASPVETATTSTTDPSTTTATAKPTESKGKIRSAVVDAAGVGMAMLGSSTAGTMLSGTAMEHVDHGHSAARWTGVSLSAIGFTVGGAALWFGVWPLVWLGGALQIAALVSVGLLNAAGFGRPDVWGELKAEAAAKRANG